MFVLEVSKEREKSSIKGESKVRLFELIFYLIFSVHYQMKRGIKNIYPSR